MLVLYSVACEPPSDLDQTNVCFTRANPHQEVPPASTFPLVDRRLRTVLHSSVSFKVDPNVKESTVKRAGYVCVASSGQLGSYCT